MALIKVKATYLDGRELTAVVPPKVLIEAEGKFAGLDARNKISASYYLTWASLRRTGQESAEYEDWLDLIESAEDVEADEADEKASDPTPMDPEPTGSSD